MYGFVKVALSDKPKAEMEVAEMEMLRIFTWSDPDGPRMSRNEQELKVERQE